LHVLALLGIPSADGGRGLLVLVGNLLSSILPSGGRILLVEQLLEQGGAIVLEPLAGLRFLVLVEVSLGHPGLVLELVPSRFLPLLLESIGLVLQVLELGVPGLYDLFALVELRLQPLNLGLSGLVVGVH